MSDISISFPPGFMAWFLLGQAVPITSLALAALVAIFVLRTGQCRRVWLRSALVIVGGAWLVGISFWAAGVVDRIRTAGYQAQHHFQLDKTTLLGGIEVPAGAWVSIDEHGAIYALEVGENASVAINGALWLGDIQLIPAIDRTFADRWIASGTLAADAVLQGIACRAGGLVVFSTPDGALSHCIAARRTVVSAEIPENGSIRVVGLACMPDQEIRLWGRQRRLGGCVLADTATVGSVICAGGAEIVMMGDGLTICTLASAQQIGPFDLSAGARVHFNQGRLDEVAGISTPLAVSGVTLPPGSTVSLCERAWEAEWAEIPEDRYVAIAGTKLTGRLNFDCGKFQYGSLFEDSVVGGRRLPRGTGISSDDLGAGHSR